MARRLAWWVRPANVLMAPAARWGQRSTRSSFGELRWRAARRAGVPEQPDPQFLADLQVLHQSFQAVPELSFMGWYGVRAELLRHLENRLRLRQCLAARPEIAAQPVPRPVFVVGLPRTGTTLLHGLLAGAPGHRAPLLWELLTPCPLDGRRADCAKRVHRAERLVTGGRLAAPVLQMIHPLAAREPEECIFALPHGMYYYNRARIPGYLDWYAHRDATADYAYLKQQLQVLQWNRPPRRWILKSPFHLWKLDALLRVFPDATLVWLHRDPATVLASRCSLAEVVRRLHNRRVDLRLLGADWCQLWPAPRCGRCASGLVRRNRSSTSPTRRWPLIRWPRWRTRSAAWMSSSPRPRVGRSRPGSAAVAGRREASTITPWSDTASRPAKSARRSPATSLPSRGASLAPPGSRDAGGSGAPARHVCPDLGQDHR